jgi:hypothetical protein
MIHRTPACLSAALAALFLAGCAKVNDTALRLVSTKVDAYAIVNGQVLTGEVILIPDRSGRVTFSPEKGGELACLGGMRYTATQSGAMELNCSDGSSTQLRYTLLTETRGYAYGTSAAGPVSLVFGLSPQDARAYLTVPPGKRLVVREGDGVLELESPPAANGS